MEDLLSSLMLNVTPKGEETQTPQAQKEYTVSEISAEIKKCVETRFSHVRIKGEIFGCKRADSGHYYLSLKDENAIIAAVCWRGIAAGLKFKPEDGLEVIATGKITTFAHFCRQIILSASDRRNGNFRHGRIAQTLGRKKKAIRRGRSF